MFYLLPRFLTMEYCMYLHHPILLRRLHLCNFIHGYHILICIGKTSLNIIHTVLRFPFRIVQPVMICVSFADAILVMMHFILRTMYVYARDTKQCVMVHPFHRRIIHAVSIDSLFYTTSISKLSEKQHSKSK